MNCISYEYLGKAASFYQKLGYQRIEVPWWATADIVNLTKPAGAKNYEIQSNDKCLVASGEQAFLYLANKGQLPAGKYQTVTPCFRNESYDSYHSKQFMKLELIELMEYGTTRWTSNNMVREIAERARDVFIHLIKEHDTSLDESRIKVVSVDNPDPIAISDQLDVVFSLNNKQVELGSYGMRQVSFATWVFGTGLAEPRFSKAITEYMNS